MLNKLTLTLSLCAALTTPVAAQTAPAAPHTHEEHHAARLVVADAKTHVLNVLDLEKGQVIASFGTPGKVSGVYAGPSGQYIYALHRDDDRVSVVHSGLSTVSHGDHSDLQEAPAYVLATLNIGPKPTHFFAHGEDIVIYNDGDGTAALFGETLLGKTNDMTFVKTPQPDHGAPALVGGKLLVGMLALNRVDAYSADGKFIKTVAECAGVHGEAARGDTVYFGCKDGVLGVTVKGDTITKTKWTNPAGTPEGTRVGTVAASEKSTQLYGNFGAGLVRWAPGSQTMTPVKLSANPFKFAFTEDGKNVLVLTADGQLHRLNAATGRIEQSASVVAATDLTDKAALRPTMTLGGEAAYISSPTTGEVLEIALKTLKTERRFKVNGNPTALALSEMHGMQH